MTFAETIAAAVAEFAERGYTSQMQLEGWMARIRAAARDELVPQAKVEEELRRTLGDVYRREIERGGIFQRHPDADRFTIQRVQPRARQELSRAIFASANLIKLNREAAVDTTLRRFAGWASSVPAGGTDVAVRREVSAHTREGLTQLAYEARRVAIDQGHKFAASLDRIMADESGAIAGVWHQHYTRTPRVDHTARNGKWFLIRGSWADERGYVRPGPAGYLQDVTQPGEEISCRCTMTYYSALRRLPPEMLTEAGREALAAARIATA